LCILAPHDGVNFIQRSKPFRVAAREFGRAPHAKIYGVKVRGNNGIMRGRSHPRFFPKLVHKCKRGVHIRATYSFAVTGPDSAVHETYIGGDDRAAPTAMPAFFSVWRTSSRPSIAYSSHPTGRR
jgi:hypothetical protein